MDEVDEGLLRIGELSRRSGVSAHVLRAWEQRYRLFEPVRSPSGFRLYSPADEQRVALMKSYLEAGIRPAEAARAIKSSTDSVEDLSKSNAASLDDLANRLSVALESYDERAAQSALNELLSHWPLESLLRLVILPFLHRLGSRWRQGAVSVSQEHFASNLLRARLSALSHDWGKASGPVAVLACPAGEQHDLPLLCFGLIAHRQGWAIRYLGPDTPAWAIAEAADHLSPALIVLAATTANAFHDEAEHLAELAQRHPLAIAGQGSSSQLAATIGARHLDSDPVTAAENL